METYKLILHLLEISFICVYTLVSVFNTVVLNLRQSNVTIMVNPAGRWVTVGYLICLVHVVFGLCVAH